MTSERIGPELFSGLQRDLAAAIQKDDPVAVGWVLENGGTVNGAGERGVTPLLYAIDANKFAAARQLLKYGANPNIRAVDGENAVTLAVRAAQPKVTLDVPLDSESDLRLLEMVLQGDGNPNTRFPNDDPALMWLVAQRNLGGIRMLSKFGADLNALNRTGDYLIIQASLSSYWDVVLTLIECGADWTVASKGITLANSIARFPVSQGAPLYSYWLRVLKFIESKGIKVPGPSPRQLNFISRGPRHPR